MEREAEERLLLRRCVDPVRRPAGVAAARGEVDVDIAADAALTPPPLPQRALILPPRAKTAKGVSVTNAPAPCRVVEVHVRIRSSAGRNMITSRGECALKRLLLLHPSRNNLIPVGGAGAW